MAIPPPQRCGERGSHASNHSTEWGPFGRGLAALRECGEWRRLIGSRLSWRKCFHSVVVFGISGGRGP